MLTQDQIAAIAEIERQIGLIRAADIPPGPPVINVDGDNLQAAINAAPMPGPTEMGPILDLGGRDFMQAITIDKPLTLRNGRILAPPNCNDVVIITGDHVSLLDLGIQGDGTTKRGIRAHGMFMVFDRIQVRNIRRNGQETQAISMWDSPGPLTVRNSVLEAGSIGFLAGGVDPTTPGTIASDLLFENTLFTRPLEWKGLTAGYACKNCFELKAARRVVARNCTFENSWAEAQTGFAIVLTPSQQGAFPEVVVEDVLFENCDIRNVGGGVNLLGFGQHSATRPTLRGNNYRFVNSRFEISRARNGGQGCLVQMAWEPDVVEFEGCNVVADGDAFLRVGDSKPITGLRFALNTVNRAGTYGIFSTTGSRGANFQTLFPGGVMEGNTFYGAHSIFRANFPNNVYVA